MRTLTITMAGQVSAGTAVAVDYDYEAGGWAYNTLELRAAHETEVGAGGGIVCSIPLSSTSASGVCSWPTNGLLPGKYFLWLRVLDSPAGLLPGCDPRGSSAAGVQVLAAAPQITRQPEDASVAEGSVASFSLAARGSGPLTYQWQKSIDAGTNWMDLPPPGPFTTYNTSPATLADDGARFRAKVSNPEGTVESAAARLTVLAGACPVPPRDVPFVRTDPPPVATGPATYGTNLLVNPSFEEPVYVGFAPSTFGYWRFDESVSVPAQQGIAPQEGNRMLHLVGSSRDIAISGIGSATASEQVQLVDLTAVATDVDAGTVRARARAWFARVAGCAETDDAFAVHVIAFDGMPDTFATRWTNGINAALAQGVSREVANMTGVNGWLQGGYRIADIRHNDPADRRGGVFGWRQVEAVLDVPAGTRFLAVIVLASENVRNDTVFPELHGHYVDDAALVLERR